jgi:hypothetical protein
LKFYYILFIIIITNNKEDILNLKRNINKIIIFKVHWVEQQVLKYRTLRSKWMNKENKQQKNTNLKKQNFDVFDEQTRFVNNEVSLPTFDDPFYPLMWYLVIYFLVSNILFECKLQFFMIKKNTNKGKIINIFIYIIYIFFKFLKIKNCQI